MSEMYDRIVAEVRASGPTTRTEVQITLEMDPYYDGHAFDVAWGHAVEDGAIVVFDEDEMPPSFVVKGYAI